MMQIYPYENVEKSKLFFRGVTESGVRDTVSEILRTGAGGKTAESEIDRICSRTDCRFRTGRVSRGRQNFDPTYYVRHNYFVRHSFQPGGVFYCV